MLSVSGCCVMVTKAKSVFLIVHEGLLELLIYISYYRCFFSGFLESVICVRVNWLPMRFSQSNCGMFCITKLVY